MINDWQIMDLSLRKRLIPYAKKISRCLLQNLDECKLRYLFCQNKLKKFGRSLRVSIYDTCRTLIEAVGSTTFDCLAKPLVPHILEEMKSNVEKQPEEETSTEQPAQKKQKTGHGFLALSTPKITEIKNPEIAVAALQCL